MNNALRMVSAVVIGTTLLTGCARLSSSVRSTDSYAPSASPITDPQSGPGQVDHFGRVTDETPRPGSAAGAGGY